MCRCTSHLSFPHIQPYGTCGKYVPDLLRPWYAFPPLACKSLKKRCRSGAYTALSLHTDCKPSLCYYSRIPTMRVLGGVIIGGPGRNFTKFKVLCTLRGRGKLVTIQNNMCTVILKTYNYKIAIVKILAILCYTQFFLL